MCTLVFDPVYVFVRGYVYYVSPGYNSLEFCLFAFVPFRFFFSLFNVFSS